MTYSNYIIKFGDINGVTDITDRVQGLQIKHACTVGGMMTASAVLTIDNDDGALTPNIGGTYSNVDWFTQAIFIDKGSSSYPLFHGIIDNFQIADNGTNSTITITCLDGYTVGGRGPLDEGIGGDDDRTHAFLQTLYNGWSLGAVVLRPPAGLPNLDGAGTPTANVDVLSVAGGGTKASPNYPTFKVSLQPLAAGTVKDIINNELLISYDVVVWPTTIDVSGSDAIYNSSFVYQLTRNSPTVYEFGPSDIPIQSLNVQYRTNELYNSAQATNWEPVTATAENTASIEKYGPRNISITSMLGEVVLASPTGPQEAAETYIANLYVNRFAESRYFPLQMSVLLEAAEDAGITEATMHNLMSSTNGLWQLAQITYTPTGAGSPQTDLAVIAGRTINAVPGRTTITLDLLPAQDYQSFVLDSNTLGVLDTNRLG